jgi:malyl-CoA/(S)-citramalyl-CoA lyase
MVPKVEGPWDIHYVDRLLAQLEARGQARTPHPGPRDPETAQGVVNVEEIATAVRACRASDWPIWRRRGA